MTKKNLLIDTDSYKASHFEQLPPNTTYVSSYIESRGGMYDYTVFNGLQAILMQFADNPITRQDVIEAREFYTEHGEPFNFDGWMHIVNKHQGKLPLYIQAVKEGLVIPTKNVLVQVTNTDPAVPWLPGWFETKLLRIWYPITVATRSHVIKQKILRGLELTADDISGALFKLHDFGSRGVSSEESAAIGGCAHLINFMGTDTTVALAHAKNVYGIRMAGYSIPAAEHSTITSWGKSREAAAYRNMINKFGGGIVAVVSDSYDIWNAIKNIWGDELKDIVVNMQGTLVIRPDSGDANTVPLKVVKALDEAFGSTVNSKGYKVLNKVRVIQGDGINEITIQNIIDSLIDAGYSTDNIAFGMGGELLQNVNRDTLKFAMKASAAMVDNQWIEVFKSPVDDPGKVSKKGKLALVDIDGKAVTVQVQDSYGKPQLLEPVFQNGEILRYQSFENIRALSNDLRYIK